MFIDVKNKGKSSTLGYVLFVFYAIFHVCLQFAMFVDQNLRNHQDPDEIILVIWSDRAPQDISW